MTSFRVLKSQMIIFFTWGYDFTVNYVSWYLRAIYYVFGNDFGGRYQNQIIFIWMSASVCLAGTALIATIFGWTFSLKVILLIFLYLLFGLPYIACEER